MHTLNQLYLDTKIRHNYITKLSKLEFLLNNQYMKPYIFTHVIFLGKENEPHKNQGWMGI